MRVIGGMSRGRRLRSPDLITVRPTSDRVREAVFDMLFSRGGVEGLQLVDLFAGTGAMGIEALSRGAASVTFVDQDTRCRDIIRQNLAAVGMDEAERRGDATVIRAEVVGWLQSTVSRFDIALCDPPYGFAYWESLLANLPADLAVLESHLEPPKAVGWEIIKSKRYGGTIVTVLRQDPIAQKEVL